MDAELSELKTVLADFQRSPKLAKLLRYLVETSVAGQSDELTEHNIAINVFDRKETSFIASDDALARVETHRLRKKLNAYYREEGKHHPLQISIPLGTYSPVFLRVHTAPEPEPSTHETVSIDSVLAESKGGNTPADHPADEAAAQKPADAASILDEATSAEVPASPQHTGTGIETSATIHKKPRVLRSRMRMVALAAGGVTILLALAISLAISRTKTRNSSDHASTPQPVPQQGAAMGAVSASVPLRIIAGYSGPPQRDSSGDLWQADEFFRNGSPLQRHNTYIDGTLDPVIYRFGRTGAVNYDIPLTPGTYELHLHFAEITPVLQSQDTVSKCMFNVQINGKVEIEDIDPISDGGGLNIADERIVRDVSPAPDGLLHLHLGIVMGIPHLSALEILPGKPGSQQDIRITAHTSAWTDRDGAVWHSDAYFRGGRKLVHSMPGTLGADADLYSAERYGSFSYLIPVDSRGRYTVKLHFAELYFGNEDSEKEAAGKRIFRVTCNGSTLLDNFDIARENGPGKSIIKTFSHLRPTAQGKLNLSFEPIKNYATVSAIEVLDESAK